MTDEDTRENEKDTHLRVYLEFDNSYERKRSYQRFIYGGHQIKVLTNCFINVRNTFS